MPLEWNNRSRKDEGRKESKDIKIGYALSGGGAKGSFQSQIMSLLTKQGVVPNIKAGISVGSLNAAVEDDQARSYLWSTMRDRDVYQKHALLKKGFQYLLHQIGIRKPVKSLYSNKPLYKKLKEVVTEKPEMKAGRVNLRTGEYASYLTDENYHKEILASTAIPGVWSPVMINGDPWVDGGVFYNTPIKEILVENPDLVVIITNQPLDKKMNNNTKDILNILRSTADIMLDYMFNRDIEEFIRKNKTKKSYPHIIISPNKDLGDPLDFSREALNMRRVHAHDVFNRKVRRIKQVVNNLR